MLRKILFIVLDQCRADLINGALSNQVDLPNIDRLRGSGTTFSNHFSVTTPCGPSRASLLTGLYAMNHRSVRNGTPLDRHHLNIAQVVRQAGLDPLLFGYTDTSHDPRNRAPLDPELFDYEGVAPGFNPVVPLNLDTNYPWRAALRQRGYDVPDEPGEVYKPVAADGGTPGICDPAMYTAADSDTAFLTDETISALSVRKHQDWLGFVGYLRPHPPLVAPAPYHQMYSPADVAAPVMAKNRAHYHESHPFYAAFETPSGSTGLFWGFSGRQADLNETQAAELRAVYFGLATEVDHHIGRLLDHLEASGEDQETLVVLTADHGEMLGDHYQWGKQSFHDAAYKVPLIIRDPRRPATAGQQVDAFTESIDLLPTLCDWLEMAPPPAVNGRSLLPFLSGDTPGDWRDHVVVEIELGKLNADSVFQQAFNLPSHRCNLTALREQNWKYVHFNGGVPPLLFDLANDPNEFNNLSGNPDFIHEELRLARKLIDHRMTHAHHALSDLHIGETGVLARPRYADNAI